jgi:SAM-dependent methyltransferase
MSLPAYIEYFDVHGKLGRVFFHPGGKSATRRLLDLLPSLGEETLLIELGCGTGETARMVLESRECSYIGIDASPEMLARAGEKTSAVSNRAKLLQLDLKSGLLPFPAGYADAIVAESVLCVLDPAAIMAECHRVLKPGGVMAWNERIFGAEVPVEECRRANAFAKELLGVEAASPDLRTAADWQALAKRTGLTMGNSERFYETRAEAIDSGWLRMLEKAGKLLLHPSGVRVLMRERRVAGEFESVWAKSEQWLFVATKGQRVFD